MGGNRSRALFARAVALVFAGAVLAAGCLTEVRVDSEVSESPIIWGGQGFAVAVHPTNRNIAFLGTAAGGLYKTTDGGGLWSRVATLPQYWIVDVEIDPSNPDIVFVATRNDTRTDSQSGVWRSGDGGATWSKAQLALPCVASNHTPSAFDVKVVEPYVFAATDCGVRIGDVSGDFGPYLTSEFSPALGNPRFYSVDAVNVGGFVQAYACGKSGVYEVTLGQDLFWTRVGPAISTDDGAQCHVGISPYDARDVVAQIDHGLYETENAGGSWRGPQAIPPSDGGGLHKLLVRPSLTSGGVNTNFEVYFSNGLTFYRQTCPSGTCPLTTAATTNIGRGTHDDPSDIGFFTDPATKVDCAYYFVNDGGVDRRTTCRADFTQFQTANKGVRALQLADVCGSSVGTGADQTDLYISSQHSGSFMSSDAGAHWTPFAGGDGVGCTVDRVLPSGGTPAMRLVFWTNGGTTLTGRLAANPGAWPGPAGYQTYNTPGAPTQYGNQLWAELAPSGSAWRLQVMKPEAGTQCSNAGDDDNDGIVNDGCPTVGTVEIASVGACHNGIDDDADGVVNDGCSHIRSTEVGTECSNAVDNDGDGIVNDGCPGVGPAESFAQCGGNVDDDADGKVNDGCREVGIWTPVGPTVASGHNVRSLRVTGPANAPRFYFVSDSTSVTFSGSLIRIEGPLDATATASSTPLTKVLWFGKSDFDYGAVYAVAPSSATNSLNDVILAEDTEGYVVRSNDGGRTTTGSRDLNLDALVTRSGEYRRLWYVDVSLQAQIRVIAFDPDNAAHIIVGAEETGLFTSSNGGAAWTALDNTGARSGNGTGKLRSPTAFFFDDSHDRVWISSYGRGLWKYPLSDAFSS